MSWRFLLIYMEEDKADLEELIKEILELLDEEFGISYEIDSAFMRENSSLFSNIQKVVSEHV